MAKKKDFTDFVKEYLDGAKPKRKPVKARAKNPARRKGTASPKRVSQITKKPPSKRLVKRRKVNTRAGYFPNPTKESHYQVQIMVGGKWKTISEHGREAHAVTSAHALAALIPQPIRVVKV